MAIGKGIRFVTQVNCYCDRIKVYCKQGQKREFKTSENLKHQIGRQGVCNSRLSWTDPAKIRTFANILPSVQYYNASKSVHLFI